MNRPTMPGVNSIALDRFEAQGKGGYAALYDDNTRGPRCRTRAEAERDYDKANAATGEQRNAIEHFGALSGVFMKWSKIHSDFKTEIDGRRYALAMDTFTGATVLAEWIGPKS